MNEELKPCLFCGGTDLLLSSMQVYCRECLANAPIDAWNTRAESAELTRLHTALAEAERERDALKAELASGHIFTEEELCELLWQFWSYIDPNKAWDDMDIIVALDMAKQFLTSRKESPRE